MIDESNLVFFTGAPGSKWSGFAHVLTHSEKYHFDTSDYNKEREFVHFNQPNLVMHNGAYFGPGFGVGEKFHRLDKLTKQEILDEISTVFDLSKPGLKIIKCHQFSKQLDYIKEMFPKSKIMIVMRPEKASEEGWFQAGGFNISYPSYRKYYKNESTMIEQIRNETRAARTFIFNNNLDINVVTRNYFEKVWNVDLDKNNMRMYAEILEGINYNTEHEKTFHLKYDVTVSTYNFE